VDVAGGIAAKRGVLKRNYAVPFPLRLPHMGWGVRLIKLLPIAGTNPQASRGSLAMHSAAGARPPAALSCPASPETVGEFSANVAIPSDKPPVGLGESHTITGSPGGRKRGVAVQPPPPGKFAFRDWCAGPVIATQLISATNRD